jgi:hypothetical protein
VNIISLCSYDHFYRVVLLTFGFGRSAIFAFLTTARYPSGVILQIGLWPITVSIVVGNRGSFVVFGMLLLD